MKAHRRRAGARSARARGHRGAGAGPGRTFAIGYAQAANLPFELGLIRNHYVGRTFIEPSDRIRHLGVRLKHNANRSTVAGKRVVLVDDSIVRGTTSTKIVAMIAMRGAAEVHMRVASPPTIHSCFYGVDTPERSELLGPAAISKPWPRSSASTAWIFLARRPLPRGGQHAPRRRAAPVLRRLLQRRLPDAARGLRPRRQRRSALADARGALSWPASPTGRVDHRREPGLGAALAERFAAEAASLVLVARTAGALRCGTSTAPRRPRDPGAARSRRGARDRSAGRRARRALRPARRPGRLRRRAWTSRLSAISSRCFRAGHDGERDRQLLLIRSSIPCCAQRPGRAVFVTRAGARGQVLLGRLRGQQGGAGSAGHGVCRRDRRTAPREPDRSGHHAHASARQRLSAARMLKLPEPTTVTDAFIALAETACSDHAPADRSRERAF